MCSFSVVSAAPKEVEFKERYDIKIRIPIKSQHVMDLLLQLYDLVGNNNSMGYKIHDEDAICSIMEVNFDRVHDTKNGFLILLNLIIKFDLKSLQSFF